MIESVEAFAARLRAAAPPAPDQSDPRWRFTDPGVDPDGALVDLLIEVERAKAAAEARSMVLIAELAVRAEGWVQPRANHTVEAMELAAAEIAPALRLASVTAKVRVDRAQRISTRLPGTLAALGAGLIDVGRMYAIDDATLDLSEADARAVEQLVLPRAGDQTAGQLRATLSAAVIAIDPDAAEKRRVAAVKERSVSRYARRDGMSAIEAVLSAVDTGEIYDLIDDIARASKTTGDTRSPDARRADAFVFLILGRDPHLGLEHPDEAPPDDGPPPPPDDELPVDKDPPPPWQPPDTEPEPSSDDPDPDGQAAPEDVLDAAKRLLAGEGDEPGRFAEPSQDGSEQDVPPTPEGGSEQDVPPTPEDGSEQDVPVTPQDGSEQDVPPTTPEGGSEQDAPVTPQGGSEQDVPPTPEDGSEQDVPPTPQRALQQNAPAVAGGQSNERGHAEDAAGDDRRPVTEDDSDGAYGIGVPWPGEPDDLDDRFPPPAMEDPAVGTTAAAQRSARGAVSELVSLCMAALAARRPRPAPWVAVTEWQTPSGPVTLAHLHGGGPITVEYARYLLAVGAARPPPPDPRDIPLTDAQRRTHDPPADLVAAIHARDGTCRHPGCRRASHRCDNDHTIRFPDGPTAPENLSAQCRKHHLLKHHGGWTVRQDADATLTWTTPTGHTYATYPCGRDNTCQGTVSLPARSAPPGKRDVA